MKVYSIRFTRQAQEQLLEIDHYIRDILRAPLAADHVLDLLEEAAMSLATMPERVRLTGEPQWAEKGIRRLLAHHFFLYFWIDKERAAIQILAVIYTSRDQKRQLATLL